MATTHKAISVSRELADKLKLLVKATLPVCVESNDSNGDPVITLSADATPAAGEKVIVIRTKMVANPEAKDILGNSAIKFGPHVIQVCTEKNYEGTNDTVLDILGPAQLLPVLVEIGRTGCQVEWYRSDNGTVPATGQMVDAKLAATWAPLYWNVLSAS